MDKPIEGPRRRANDRHPKGAATVLAGNGRGLRDRTPDLPNRRSIPCPVHHPIPRAGARKLAPLPVWSCGKSTALHVSPFPSGRTNRVHKLGLQVQNRKNSILLGWTLDSRVRPGHDGGVPPPPTCAEASVGTSPVTTGEDERELCIFFSPRAGEEKNSAR